MEIKKVKEKKKGKKGCAPKKVGGRERIFVVNDFLSLFPLSTFSTRSTNSYTCHHDKSRAGHEERRKRKMMERHPT